MSTAAPNEAPGLPKVPTTQDELLGWANKFQTAEATHYKLIMGEIDSRLRLRLRKQTPPAKGPGVGKVILQVEAGSGAGTAKLVMYAGTSTTGVTIADNVGAGF